MAVMKDHTSMIRGWRSAVVTVLIGFWVLGFGFWVLGFGFWVTAVIPAQAGIQVTSDK
jgi:hypothetical protein